LLEVAADLVDLRFDDAPVVASQKFEELASFLERARALRPSRVCEIGTSGAGTLYLLTRVSAPDALVISVDLSIPLHTSALRARFGRPGQRLVSLEGDSHDDRTLSRLERLLDGNQLDVLFIDGDHTYEGVRSDFERYGKLVRAGGLIALHDVNEDFRTRHSVDSPSVSGEVPRFWDELKARYRTEELIADPNQDGYGIGLVYV
jgi:predicted O-methyltransferase YrrM